MKFNKEIFAKQLEQARGDRSINKYADECGISAAHISRLLRQMINTPPSPDTIKKLADKAYNGITYYQLMQSAGHLAPDEIMSSKIKKMKSIIHNNDIPQKAKDAFDGIKIKQEKINALVRLKNELDFTNQSLDEAIKEMKEIDERIIEVPIIGYVPAGKPILSEETIIGYLPFAFEVLNNLSENIFCLQIHGDSMIEIGISDNDIILVQAQSTAENGQTVIARLTDGEVTCKRFYKLNETCRLEPANKNYAPIDCKDLEIIGVVKKVIKDVY